MPVSVRKRESKRATVFAAKPNMPSSSSFLNETVQQALLRKDPVRFLLRRRMNAGYFKGNGSVGPVLKKLYQLGFVGVRLRRLGFSAHDLAFHLDFSGRDLLRSGYGSGELKKLGFGAREIEQLKKQAASFAKH